MLIGENVSQWVFDEVLDDLAERFEDKSIWFENAKGKQN